MGRVCCREFVADLQKVSVPLWHKLMPWPQPGGSGSGPAYMTLNTAKEHLRAARGAPESRDQRRAQYSVTTAARTKSAKLVDQFQMVGILPADQSPLRGNL